MIRDILQKISALMQGADSSYKRHNSELESPEALEKERTIALDRLDNDAINDPELRIDSLLEKHPDIDTAIDIGSGAGWGSAAMAARVSRVVAIEPSSAGINIAKRIFSDTKYSTIEWRQGFSEEVLPTLRLTSPTIFFTGCVLSHLRDNEVVKICKAVNTVAPKGSVLSFAECWGDQPWHQLMWHVRTKDWWQEQLPGWELTFHGPQVEEKDEYKGIYHKGFWGVKK